MGFSAPYKAYPREGQSRLCKAQREDFLGQPFDGDLTVPFLNFNGLARSSDAGTRRSSLTRSFIAISFHPRTPDQVSDVDDTQ